jgi:PAS domain S-box-containing protein
MVWFKIRKFIRLYLLAFASALMLASLTLLTFYEIYNRVEERNRVLFEVRAENAKGDINKRIQDYIQILKGAQGLLDVSDTVSLQDWKNYIAMQQVDKNYPGILGIGYTVFLPQEQVRGFEGHVQSAGFPKFEVWPKKSNTSHFSSILYLEPFNARNQRAFGYDMFTDSIRREAMELARDSGAPAISGMVTLVQETTTGTQKGFLLYLPVYRGEEPLTVAERREQLTAFVYSPFRVNDLMFGILGRRFSDLDVQIFDSEEANAQTLLYDKDGNYSSGTKQAIPELEKEFNLQVGQHNWHVVMAAKPGFGYETAFPWLILTGGLLISGLLFIVMFSLANIRRGTYLREVITDNATAALFILNTKDYCTFMNPAAEILTGFTFEELREQSLHSQVHHSHPDGRFYEPSECPIIKTLSSSQSLINHEDVFYRRNGEKVDVSINARPLYERGQVTSYLMEVRDISQEKEAEKALRGKNRDLELLNKIGKNLSAELELEKLLQIVTDTCTELTGAEIGAFFYNRKEEGETLSLYTLSGKNKETFHRFPMPRNTAVFAPTLEEKILIRSDDIMQDNRFGKNAPFHGLPESHFPVKSYLAVPVVSREGTIIGGLFFGHSATGRFSAGHEEIVKAIASQAAIAIDNSQLFNDLNNKNGELQQINSELDNFVYTASHDLKAPVLNIEGLIYALTASLENEKHERVPMMIEMMKTSVLKFKETIQALTDIARTNKNLDEEPDVIDLQEVLEDIRVSMNELIQDTGTRIEVKLGSRYIRFPKANMMSVLQNLIQNAIKYRSPERLPLIIFNCECRDNKLVIEVKDNGMGIPENQLNKIFVMFKRYHTHIEGTGVGLYLVKRIIENYKGSVAVESEVDKGTTFTIVLPARNIANPQKQSQGAD